MRVAEERGYQPPQLEEHHDNGLDFARFVADPTRSAVHGSSSASARALEFVGGLGEREVYKPGPSGTFRWTEVVLEKASLDDDSLDSNTFVAPEGRVHHTLTAVEGGGEWGHATSSSPEKRRGKGRRGGSAIWMYGGRKAKEKVRGGVILLYAGGGVTSPYLVPCPPRPLPHPPRSPLPTRSRSRGGGTSPSTT